MSINVPLSHAYTVDSLIDRLAEEIRDNWKDQPFYLETLLKNLEEHSHKLVEVCK
jgi:hypothetical protein